MMMKSPKRKAKYKCKSSAVFRLFRLLILFFLPIVLMQAIDSFSMFSNHFFFEKLCKTTFYSSSNYRLCIFHYLI